MARAGSGKREAGSGKAERVNGARVAERQSDASPASRLPLPASRLIDLYYWMRLTRTLEERLVALYRQTKVVGGLFRSLGQEADAVGSTFALERRDIMSP